MVDTENTTRYTVTGMTCSGCQAKVEKLLSGVSGVRNISIDLARNEATIETGKTVPIKAFQDALKDYPKYQLSKHIHAEHSQVDPSHSQSQDTAILSGTPPVLESSFLPSPVTDSRSWLAIYKPILLLFGYISVLSAIAGSLPGGFDGMLAMRVFMSGFFLVFSFFKMLDLRAFADSYAMYDIIAMRFKYWGYVYAFLEVVLGIAFALNFQPILTNSLTLLVMSISIAGVLRSVLNERKIQCACLGTVFNLPMSTVTIVEDALMIGMSSIAIAELILSGKG